MAERMEDQSEEESHTENHESERESQEVQQERELKGERNSKVEKPKDIWDKVSSVTPLLIGIFVTAGGTYLGQLHNSRQDKIAEVSALEKFQHLLTSREPSERELGYACFAALGYESLAIRLSLLTSDQASKPVIESIKQSNPGLSPEVEVALKNLNIDKTLLSDLEGGLNYPDIINELRFAVPEVEKLAKEVGVQSKIGLTVLLQSGVEWRPFINGWAAAATTYSGGESI
jgi:hypothetical protein